MFGYYFNQDLKSKIENVVTDLKEWNQETSVKQDEIDKMSSYIGHFEHCRVPDREFSIGGTDGSGEFPVASYGDSYIYFVTALTKLFHASTREGRLKEQPTSGGILAEFLWLPEDQEEKDKRYEQFFCDLVGIPLSELCSQSDYISLRLKHTGQPSTPEELIQLMIKPQAHDAGNVRIHLMTATEICTIIKALQNGIKPTYFLADTTLTLPFVKKRECLFFELAKRYCCRLARENGVAFFALSKSHNIPHMDQLEELIKRKDYEDHWYLRIPTQEFDGFSPEFLGTRGIPPVGGMTYIFRLHKTTPPMRLDMDINYWRENIWHADKEIMTQREVQVFRDLDFASHDQRCYGYPYPIKASHDSVSLTQERRLTLRKQIIDMAESAGLKRRNFADASMLTGHR